MPIFVLVFWLKVVATDGNVSSVALDSMEFGGYAKSPQICASLPMGEVVKPLPDAAEKIEAGLVPRVVCGIAAPDQQIAVEPPAVRSEPGHPDQPQRPSAPL